jgi:hypothetical protein
MTKADEKHPVNMPVWIAPWSARNRDTVLTFLVCLVVSTVLWFMNALSKDYVTTIHYPVEYVDLPKKKFIINNPPAHLNLKVNTQGFTIVKYKLMMSFSPLLINVSELLSDNIPSASGFFVIPSKNLSENLSSQLSMDVELLDITPGVLSLAFDSLDVKRVPVASEIELGFKPRYGLASPVMFEPSYVTISGPHDMIQNTDTVFTVPKSYYNVGASFKQNIPLILPRRLYVEPDHVTLIATVDEFTESTVVIPVWINNQPDSSKIRLFPREVEVRFKVALSKYTQIKPEDFSLYVSWEEISHNADALKVKVKKSPLEVKNLKITPEHVEYLIEKN